MRLLVHHIDEGATVKRVVLRMLLTNHMVRTVCLDNSGSRDLRSVEDNLS